MEQTLDAFDFQLAESLGMTVREMNERMGMDEYAAWRAYHVWHNAQLDMARKQAQSEASRGR